MSYSNLSKECLAESFAKASKSLSGDDQIIMRTISELVSNDRNYYIGLIDKIVKRTNLSKTIIQETIRRFGSDKNMLKSINIDVIAENL